MNGNYQGTYGGGGRNTQQDRRAYTVDMVLCIDATGSMENRTGGQQKIINMVKENALHFYDDLAKKMDDKKKPMAQLRVRLVLFRDFLADGPHALQATDFFVLPDQVKSFEACVNSIHADGGGDIPEDGLEALAYAMQSNWTTHGTNHRQLIVVWTDAGTHELGYGRRSPHYPEGMPASLAELEDMWDAMDDYSKRLLIYAPDTNYWNYIGENFEQTIHVVSKAGEGLQEQNYEEILHYIAESISRKTQN